MAIRNLVVWICMYSVVCEHFVDSQTTSQSNVSTRTVVKLSVIKSDPYLIEHKDGRRSGYVVDLIQMLAEVLPKYEFKLNVRTDGAYGTLMENDTWTGMIGEVVSGAADLAFPLTMSSTRDRFVDFSFPLQSADPAIVLRRPLRQTSVQEKLTRLMIPIDSSVWLTTIMAFFVTGTILYIISRTNPYEWRRMAKDKEATIREAESFTCLNSFWFVISTLTWQGYVRAPRSIGGRTAVTAWWFFVLIFIVSYTASLTNLLRVGLHSMEAPIHSTLQSYADLIERDDVYVGMVSNGATSRSFKHSQVEEDIMLYKKHEEFEKMVKPLHSYAEGIEYLRSRNFLHFAMIMETPSARFYAHQKPCDLYMVIEKRGTRFLSIAVGRNSALSLNDLNHALLMLYEANRLVSLEKKWFETKCKAAIVEMTKDTYKTPPAYQLTLATFSGAFLILVTGLVLGGLVSCVELCIYKWAESHSDGTETTCGHTEMTTSELLPSESTKVGATHV